MKKFFKTFLITFIICCTLLFLFLLRNYMIINQIRDLQAQALSKLENSNNFLYEEFSTGVTGDVKSQIYFKDGIYK